MSHSQDPSTSLSPLQYTLLASLIIIIRLLWHSYLQSISSRFLTRSILHFLLRLTRFSVSFVIVFGEVLLSEEDCGTLSLYLAASKYASELLRRYKTKRQLCFRLLDVCFLTLIIYSLATITSCSTLSHLASIVKFYEAIIVLRGLYRIIYSYVLIVHGDALVQKVQGDDWIMVFLSFARALIAVINALRWRQIHDSYSICVQVCLVGVAVACGLAFWLDVNGLVLARRKKALKKRKKTLKRSTSMDI